CLDGEQYDDQRAVAARHAQVAMRKPLTEFQAYAREQMQGRRRFHWPAEFPEVFGCGGFHAVVGNPPFMGGKKISTSFGDDYRRHLGCNLAHEVKGSADLCAYFFLRAGSLVRPRKGMIGLLATNTIAQGDTREVGLEQMVGSGFVITRAVQSRPWPGAASLEVAHVWLCKGSWAGECVLDEAIV